MPGAAWEEIWRVLPPVSSVIKDADDLLLLLIRV